MKSVPVEKIDALIARLDKERKEDYAEYGENKAQFRWDGGIRYLEEIKKESEEMIPLSTVKARIKELEDWDRGTSDDRTQYAIEELKELTKDKEK